MEAINIRTARLTKSRCTCRLLLGAIVLFCFLPKVYAQQSSQPEVPVETDSVFVFKYRPELPEERYFSIKTNLVAWAGTILNVAADLQLSRHLSLELPLLWCPWYAGGRHAVRTFTLQPEVRYWHSKPGMGHFIGLHAHVGWFNVKWNDRRYQDPDRPLLGAGISYGYLLPLNSRWAAEFNLGAGYANIKYDTYYNINNGGRFDTQTKNYWGITRVGISLIYRLNGAK